MARSVKKGPYVQESLLRKVDLEGDTNRNKVIKTWSRRSTIIPEFVGMTFAVHNGKKFVPVFVSENMVWAQTGVSSLRPAPIMVTVAIRKAKSDRVDGF